MTQFLDHRQDTPARHFLSFDGRHGGRTTEVFGDLSRVAAMALQQELGGRSAVAAWLGYETPGSVSPEALTPGRADDAAPKRHEFLSELSAAKPAAQTSVLPGAEISNLNPPTLAAVTFGLTQCGTALLLGSLRRLLRSPAAWAAASLVNLSAMTKEVRSAERGSCREGG